MKKSKVIFLLFAVFVLFSESVMADCNREQSKALYEAAMAEANMSRRIGLLERSVSECANFKAYYALSGAYVRDGQMEKAEQTLLTVRDLMAGDAKSLSRIFSRLGQIYEEMDKEQAAYLSFKESYRHHPFPKVLEKLKALDTRRMNQGMKAGEIKKALICPASRNFQVEPSLDIFINFEFDKASLSPSGRSQAEELGRAISDEVFSGKRFTLIGHTDAVGSHEYNDDLSERRARSVKAYLSGRFPKLAGNRLRIEGFGKRRLLYPDDPENALNRRVAVQVE